VRNTILKLTETFSPTTSKQTIMVVGSTLAAHRLSDSLWSFGHKVKRVFPSRQEAPFQTLFDGSIPCDTQMSAVDVVVCATTDDDHNLATAVIPKKVYGVGRVLALVGNPTKAFSYRIFPVETVCVTSLIENALLRRIENPDVRVTERDYP
jgi:hypothetical protein